MARIVEKRWENLCNNLWESCEKIYTGWRDLNKNVVRLWESWSFARDGGSFATGFAHSCNRYGIVEFTQFPHSLLLQLLII